MQVLGDLVKLPSSSELPLPWWHRAPLGFQSRTWCYVALVSSEVRPAPDLVVSVLDPSNWRRTLRVECRRRDEPGVVSKAIAAAEDFNIALAESVTIDAGKLHEITLFCELPEGADLEASAKKLREKLKEMTFENIDVSPLDARKILWVRRGVVVGGWIRKVDWRKRLSGCVDASARAKLDFGRAVVSADTSNRLLRFTFPFKNAKTIRVEHRDRPGVLKSITDVFLRHGLNMLSKLLRRGGCSPGNAMAIAACEPMNGAAKETVFDDVRAGLEELDSQLMIDCSINDGVDARTTIAPREAGVLSVRTPSAIVDRVRRIRSGLAKGEIAVFLSRRFVDEPHADAAAKAVREAATDAGCRVLEASPQQDVSMPDLVHTEVVSKMWAADAGIVLISGLKAGEPLGKNLPHEFGFMQGQGKPVLLLIERGLETAQYGWSNVDGVYAPRFPSDEVAYSKDRAGSLYDIVGRWVLRIRDYWKDGDAGAAFRAGRA